MLTLDSLDTAGVEQFISMRDHQMRDRDGFILVYDITNPSSLDDLHDLHAQILRNKLTSPNKGRVPLVLVGNKLDLANERKVPGAKAEDLAHMWKCSLFETSAKVRVNVDEVFYEIVRRVLRQREGGEESGDGTEADDDDDDVVDGDRCCVIS
jgi:small GTP-binding protein